MSRPCKKMQRSPLVSIASELQSTESASIGGNIHADQGVIGWPHAWQCPAATEETAWKNLISGLPPQGSYYVGFPWATLIDGLEAEAPVGWRLLRKLEQLRNQIQKIAPGARIATVCQHIHGTRFMDLFKRIGITDLFWSHAVKSQPEIEGIKIHGFPLYPAQLGEALPQVDPAGDRKWRANFIGAYNPTIYISDVRARIFRDVGKKDFLIVKREAWHFDRAVYQQQVAGVEPDQARLALEEQHKQEYLDAIRDSTFTLCPTGSGPNSIRIYESLGLGSIPVILTRDLALPGDPALWDAVCVFEDDSPEGYAQACDAMRSLTDNEICARRAAIPKLFAAVGPASYGGLISDAMRKINDEDKTA